MSIDLVLDALNQDVTMTLGAQVDTLEQQTLTTDADAKLYVSLTQFHDLFQFQTDASDVDTLKNASDVQYKTDSSVLDAASSLNPFAAKVVSGFTGSNAYASNKLCVRHDYVRKMAKDVFNTERAVDIFENETALLDDLTEIGTTTVHNALVSAIDAADGMLESQDTSANLVKRIVDQMLALAPERFDVNNTDVSYVMQDTNAFQRVPFNDGDTIRFKLNVNPSSTAANSVVDGLPGPSAKSYEIIMELREAPNGGTYDNEVPSDDGSSYNATTAYYSKQ